MSYINGPLTLQETISFRTAVYWQSRMVESICVDTVLGCVLIKHTLPPGGRAKERTRFFSSTFLFFHPLLMMLVLWALLTGQNPGNTAVGHEKPPVFVDGFHVSLWGDTPSCCICMTAIGYLRLVISLLMQKKAIFYVSKPCRVFWPHVWCINLHIPELFYVLDLNLALMC